MKDKKPRNIQVKKSGKSPGKLIQDVLFHKGNFNIYINTNFSTYYIISTFHFQNQKTQYSLFFSFFSNILLHNSLFLVCIMFFVVLNYRFNTIIILIYLPYILASICFLFFIYPSNDIFLNYFNFSSLLTASSFFFNLFNCEEEETWVK